MEIFLLKAYEHAGYHETRLVLMAVSLVVAFYYGYYRRDERYGVMLTSGVLLQSLAEAWLQSLNGAVPVALFGVFLPQIALPVYRGFAEGGVAVLFAFWLTDILKRRSSEWQEWTGFCIYATLLALFAVLLGHAAKQQPFAAQAILTPGALLFALVVGAGALVQAGWQRNLSGLCLFAASLLLYSSLAGEPLRAAGALQFSRTPLAQGILPIALQWRIALLYYLLVQTFSQLHFLMIPFAFKLIEWRAALVSVAPHSDETLERLAERGWSWESKPFADHR